MAPLIEVTDKVLDGMNKLKIPYDLKTRIDLQFITDENLYKEIIKYLDKTFPAQKSNLSAKLKFKDNVMKGSNPYIATAVDMYFSSINSKFRIARQRDLETNLQMFKGFYVDSGLALRSLEASSKKQAKYLFAQLKQKAPNFQVPIFQVPIWIDLRGLSLDNNLNFNLGSESQYKTAECLNWKYEKKYSEIDEFGLPKEINKNSNRQIFIRNSGLFKACLDDGSDLIFGYSYLGSSNDYGRVVIAKP